MKIIPKYVLREHAGPMTFALTALTSLLLLNYIAKNFGQLVGKGLPWQVIAQFFVLSLPFTVAMTLPMAVLIAVLYAFSRLAAENEVTALKASGVGMGRLLVPVTLASAVLALFMVYFNDQVLPASNHELSTLQGDIARKKPTFALRARVLNEISPGQFYMQANHLEEYSNKMREVTIYDLGDALRRRTIVADSGTMELAPNGKDLQMTLFHGYIQEVPRNDPAQFQRLYYVSDQIRIANVANQFEADSTGGIKSDREKTVCELQDEVSAGEQQLAIAQRDLRATLVALTREAATGEPARNSLILMPPSSGIIIPQSRADSGKPAPTPGPSAGRIYCDLVARLADLVRGQPVTVASRRADGRSAHGLGVRSLEAAELPADLHARDARAGAAMPQARDTTPKDTTRRDTTRRDTTRRDTTARRADSAKAIAPADTARTDSTARKDTAHAAPATAPTAGPREVPRPATALSGEKPPQPVVQPPGTTPVPGQLQTPAVPGATPGAAVTPGAVAPGAPAPVVNPAMQPSVSATTAIEAARGKMIEARDQVNNNAVEVHKKFALSAAVIIFVLLGAPLALRFPRGGVGFVIGASLLIFAIYYVGLIGGEPLGNEGYLPPWLSMWLPNIIFLLVAIVMLSRMGRESSTSRGGDLSELMGTIRGFFARPFRRAPRDVRLAAAGGATVAVSAPVAERLDLGQAVPTRDDAAAEPGSAA